MGVFRIIQRVRAAGRFVADLSGIYILLVAAIPLIIAVVGFIRAAASREGAALPWSLATLWAATIVASAAGFLTVRQHYRKHLNLAKNDTIEFVNALFSALNVTHEPFYSSRTLSPRNTCEAAMKAVAEATHASCLRNSSVGYKKMCLIVYDKDGNADGRCLLGFSSPEASMARVRQHLSGRKGVAYEAIKQNLPVVVNDVRPEKAPKYYVRLSTTVPSHDGLMAAPVESVRHDHNHVAQMAIPPMGALCMAWKAGPGLPVGESDIRRLTQASVAIGLVCSMVRSVYNEGKPCCTLLSP